jgi:hypothetical protein
LVLPFQTQPLDLGANLPRKPMKLHHEPRH